MKKILPILLSLLLVQALAFSQKMPEKTDILVQLVEGVQPATIISQMETRQPVGLALKKTLVPKLCKHTRRSSRPVGTRRSSSAAPNRTTRCALGSGIWICLVPPKFGT